jgi:hypothetical protein
MGIRKVAASLPFAHLLGIKAEEEESKKTRAEEQDGEEEQDKDAKADDEDDMADEEDGDEKDEKKGGKKAKAKRAEEEGSDGGDDGDEEGKKSRKAKRADDDEDDSDKSAQAVRRRERARCSAIMAHGITSGQVRQAAILAFDTNMTSKIAIASLKASNEDGATAQPRSKSLADRMTAANVQNVGSDTESNSGAPNLTKTAAAIIAIGEKVRSGK